MINLDQNHGRRKVTVYNPKNTSCFKQGGSSALGSLMFLGYVTTDRGRKINPEVYGAIISARIQPKASKK